MLEEEVLQVVLRLPQLRDPVQVKQDPVQVEQGEHRLEVKQLQDPEAEARQEEVLDPEHDRVVEEQQEEDEGLPPAAPKERRRLPKPAVPSEPSEPLLS